MSRHLHIQMLCYTHPELEVMEFLQGEIIQRLTKGTDFGVSYSSIMGNSMLPHARNTAVSDFLNRPECTDLLFIDADNYPSPGGVLKMMQSDVDVLGLPCRGKKDDMQWPVRWLTDRPIARSPNGLIEVETVGTGIMRITRKCLEAMKAAEGRDGWYFDKYAASGKSWPLFKYSVRDFNWYGEDVTFCLRWRELGGQVWIDPDVETHHIGRKDYSGSIGEWLKAMPKNVSISKQDAKVANSFSADA